MGANAESNPFDALLETHNTCQWKQMGPCVYCTDHDLRLYQGQLPSSRRPPCAEHDWDYEQGLGFYFICRRCGEREWTE
jgi:hypothetical protein